MNQKLITIATFPNSVEAALSKQLLEGVGIPAFVINADIADVAWYYTIMVGWIKLKVRECDVENAVDILTATSVELDEDISQEMPISSEESEFNYISKPDKIIDFAFRASIIGLFSIPFLLHLYSLALLIYLLFTGWHVSANTQLKALATFLINISVMRFTWLIFSNS
ncbi:hypothetical protein [Calothrix sp. PCC 6303]|uniref:hypothetical protein n=1 Tax=Calothrix sp. PCC 6303 TaxID=1170562 RepID=UPI0002A019DC|nr:hypothetical protein [Calothrix sp. PCC 6303]AFZ04155.1 hypothetical protein Cal6303_5269 [Calothrix sp. PCC 6303]